MTSIFALKLSFKVCHINVKAKRIDGINFKTFEIVLASFQIKNKLGLAKHFQKTFLLANTNIEIVLEIFFMTFSSAEISFTEKKIT